MINEQISASEIRLVGQEGEQLGIISFNEALTKANMQGLDLVLLNGTAKPYVCKIMDYGKFKFDSLKKEKELKKNQKIVDIKEIQLSMTIDTHDMEVKAKNARKFLESGDKVKVILKMRGRQQAYTKTGVEVVNKFFALCGESASFDKAPEVTGRNIILIINPKKL